MAKSMTAYGRAQGILGGKKITVELKSVNSRYFDPQIRISRAYSALEEKLKARVQSEISRGKIDISLFVEVLENTECEIRLDHAYTAGYLKALTDLRDAFGLADDISVMKVAQNKDIFTFVTPEVSADQLWEEVLPFVDQALASFHTMRMAEGERLKTDLMQKKANILALADQVSVLSRDCIEKYHDKFETRIRKLIGESGVEIDEQRILTECAIYADKVSIDEELVRLNSHFQSFDEIFESEEPIGRKLDFLVQEMNRETNTIGSKANDLEISTMVVDMKAELEKIREQIQNVE